MGHYLVLTLLLITNVTPTFSFPFGAPQSACETLAPNATQHGAQPKTSDIPYLLNLSALYDQILSLMVYTPNSIYNLTLEATAAAPTFRGFLIQPRMFADDSTVVGQFQEPPVGEDYGYSNCSYREGSITHTNGSNKSDVTILWTAPSNGTGRIWFRYAVVQTAEVYWANQTSAAIEERHPCLGGPCQNGGSCVSIDDQTFDCTCHPAYSGSLCENLTNPCALEPCQHGGTCTNVISNSSTNIACNNGQCVDGVGTFTCQCDLGYTGDHCDVEIDECAMANCQNGKCEDLVNGYRCQCYTGWTGEECETDIDYCTIDTARFGPCDDTGAVACVDDNSTYTCACVIGFTGYNCSEDIDECEPNPCQNGGNCSSFLFSIFECSCPLRYSGPLCETERNPCELQPCQNGATCNDLGTGTYSCDYLQGYTGHNCETELPDCTPVNPCQNGGTCMEQVGPGFFCMCPPGYTDQQCCTYPCENGSCTLFSRTEYTCNSSVGYTCENCSIPIDDCNNVTCICRQMSNLTGGFHCECPFLYTGQLCEDEIVACSKDICQNGGTCHEQDLMSSSGVTITCNCSEGFDGMACEEDDVNFIACEIDSCENEGTCLEEFGPSFSCNCREGFSGDLCEHDLEFCNPNQCSNGGTCVEGVGTITSCICVPGFTGQDCSIPMALCNRARFLFNEKCHSECPDGFYGDDTSKQCKPVIRGYKLQLNSTVYYANISSGTKLNSIVLNFSLYINNTYYQTPESVFFQLGSSNQFTSYFSFSNHQSVEMISFSLSNPNHSTDALKVSRSIIYRKEAPLGEYHTMITVILITREEVQLIPHVDTHRATLTFTVSDGSAQPPVGLLVNPLIFWVIVGLTSAFALVIIFCFFTLCCYCIYCFTRRRRRQKYVVEKADGSLTIENPSADLGRGTLTGAVAIEDQSVPRLESVKEITTAFTDGSNLS